MVKKPMPWSERFALIEHFRPTDPQICSAFGLSLDELNTARSLLGAGSLFVSKKLKLDTYPNIFTEEAIASPTISVARTTVGPGATKHQMPETAGRRHREPQKRGRKGSKISNALMAVPMERMPVDDFIRQHDVSLAVLRQSRRFIETLPDDVRNSFGTVHVRQDKTSKTLMIWRELPEAKQ